MFDATGIGKFEFARLATLRTAQLIRGCRPLVPACGKMTTTAQREVAAGFVSGLPRKSIAIPPV